MPLKRYLDQFILDVLSTIVVDSLDWTISGMALHQSFITLLSYCCHDNIIELYVTWRLARQLF